MLTTPARAPHTLATQRPVNREPLRRGWHVASLEKLREEFLKAKAFSTRRGEPASPDTLASYKYALRSFENHAAHETGHDLGTAFTPRMVETWFHHLQKRGLSRKALASVYQPAIREFAKWGLKRGYWRVDPTADLQVLRAPKGLPRPFTPAERDALMALPLEPKEAALRGVLYYLGLRSGTIARVRLGDIVGPQTLADGRTILGFVWTLGKGNKEGVKPIHADLWRLLVAYDDKRAPDDKRPECFLFANGDGTPWTRKTIQRRVAEWGTAARVEKCTPHRFRHTAATDLFTRTNDIYAVNRLLGHASLHTTQIYAQLVDQRLAEAVSALPSFGPQTPALDSETSGSPTTADMEKPAKS